MRSASPASCPSNALHAALDDGAIVGGAGVYPFELTVPGGPLACAGVTVVGVLPSHRRRGLLRRMMAAQLRDVRERGEPLAALWASEETIYGRFGYGLASLSLNVKTDRRAGGLRPGLRRAGRARPPGRPRRGDPDVPALYDRVRRRSVGFLSRSREWWELKQLDDRPEERRGGGPLHRALLEIDGRPAGYALYRVVSEGSGADWRKTLRVKEAIGIDARATRELWRFLLSVDWIDAVEMWMLPVDHPLQLLVARVNLLQARVWDGLWVRLVDVGAALSGRGYAGDGRVTFEVVADPLFPDNVGTGRWPTASRGGPGADRTYGSTCRRSPPPTWAGSRSRSWPQPKVCGRWYAAASPVPTRSFARTPLPGAPRTSDPRLETRSPLSGRARCCRRAARVPRRSRVGCVSSTATGCRKRRDVTHGRGARRADGSWWPWRGREPSPALLTRIREGRVGGVILFGPNVSSARQVRELSGRSTGGGRRGRPPAAARCRRPGGRRLPASALGATGAAGVAARSARHGRARAGRSLDRPGAAACGRGRRPRPGGGRPAHAVVVHRRAGARVRLGSARCRSAGGGVCTRACEARVAATAKHFPGLGSREREHRPRSRHDPGDTRAAGDRSGAVSAPRGGGVPLVMLSNAVYTALGPAPAAWSATGAGAAAA